MDVSVIDLLQMLKTYTNNIHFHAYDKMFIEVVSNDINRFLRPTTLDIDISPTSSNWQLELAALLNRRGSPIVKVVMYSATLDKSTTYLLKNKDGMISYWYKPVEPIKRTDLTRLMLFAGETNIDCMVSNSCRFSGAENKKVIGFHIKQSMFITSDGDKFFQAYPLNKDGSEMTLEDYLEINPNVKQWGIA